MLILLGRCEKYFLNERSHFDQKFYFPKFAYRTLLKVLSDAYETKDTYCNINHICKKKKKSLCLSNHAWKINKIISNLKFSFDNVC